MWIYVLLNIQSPLPELKACVIPAPSGTRFGESITCECSGLVSREMWRYKTGGDIFRQPRQEQLESCGGAGCSKGWREVYGHHIPLWDLWTLDAGCYLLLGWTETYCCELPPPHASALCSSENPGVGGINGKGVPKRSCFLSRLSTELFLKSRHAILPSWKYHPLVYRESVPLCHTLPRLIPLLESHSVCLKPPM